MHQGRHLGGQGEAYSPPDFEKKKCFCKQNFVFSYFAHFAPPRKSVKMLPPLEKTEMTSLVEVYSIYIYTLCTALSVIELKLVS